MRIQFAMEGGIAHFPGLSKPVTIDTAELPREQAVELEQLVDAAHFFQLPALASAPPRGAADYYQYTITVEEAGRRHSVQLTDPFEDPDLQKLVAFLKAKAKTLRAAARTRSSD